MEEILKAIAPALGILFYAFLIEWWRSYHPILIPTLLRIAERMFT